MMLEQTEKKTEEANKKLYKCSFQAAYIALWTALTPLAQWYSSMECRSEEHGSNLLFLIFLLYFTSEGCWFESREQEIYKILSTQIRNIPTPLPYQGSAQLPHHDKKYSAQKRRLDFVPLSLIWVISLWHGGIVMERTRGGVFEFRRVESN